MPTPEEILRTRKIQAALENLKRINAELAAMSPEERQALLDAAPPLPEYVPLPGDDDEHLAIFIKKGDAGEQTKNKTGSQSGA